MKFKEKMTRLTSAGKSTRLYNNVNFNDVNGCDINKHKSITQKINTKLKVS